MLLRTWFGLVNSIILIALFLVLFNFEIKNVLNWVSLIALVLALALSMIIYIEKPHAKETIKLKKDYADFLKRKDKIIDEMRQKNDLIFNTAKKRSEADIELAELKKKWEEKTKE
ncbi:hypothetical protein JXB27_03885 [Candidatus Woesearchaeota archaeon]|nr:hypothetical protein [Candidatus Woesearchaeota archaeon]